MDDRSPLLYIMSGRAGWWSLPIRGLLHGASLGYGQIIRARNRRYDEEPSATLRVAAPVISVGNITVGGTGKTPLVIDLVRRLQKLNRTPAVVARGYGARRNGVNDEQMLIERRCGQVIYETDKDRVLAARRAVEREGCDTIILDDGFQHRRLARDLNVVLVDATQPFGFGHLLPRGLLREPARSLKRADLVIVTRCDQVSTADRRHLQKELAALAPDVQRLSCSHRVVGLVDLQGRECGERTEGKRALLFAAIGNPRSFRTTAKRMGIDVVAEHWWPDHHQYREKDITRLLEVATRKSPDLLLTTEKDAVKLAAFGELRHLRLLVVRVDIAFHGDDGKAFQRALEGAVSAFSNKPSDTRAVKAQAS